MKLVSFIFVGLISLVSFDAWGAPYGQDKTDGTIRGLWGINTDNIDCTTFGDNFTQELGCLSNCGVEKTVKNAMIARDLNANGAQFCLTAIAVRRVNNSSPTSTLYYGPKGDAVCFWLCKDGFTGEKCETSLPDEDIASNQKTCDFITSVDMESYRGREDSCTHGGAGSKNISCNTASVEKQVSMFYSKSTKCEDKLFNQNACDSAQEMDIVLGLLESAPSKHGAWAQAMTVRAFCGKNKNDSLCKIAIQPMPTASKFLLCLDGYRPNATNTDCVAISAARCSGSNMSECKGWDSARFSDTTHKTHPSYNANGQSCIEYRCAAEGYGFAGDPASVVDCIKCEDTDTQKATLVEQNGRCMFSDYDKKAVINDDGTMTQISLQQSSKSDLSSATNNRNELCWMVSDTPSQYKECILGVRSEQKDTSNVPGKHPTTHTGAVTNFSTQITNNLQPSGNLSDLSTLGNETTSQTSGTTIPGPNINPATYDIYKNIQNSNIKLNGKQRFNN